MRLSSPLTSLLIILSIHLAFVQSQSIIGTWSNVTVLSRKSSLCCIPNSMKIDTQFISDSSLKVSYKIPAIYNDQSCLSLFGSVTDPNLDVSKQYGNVYYGQKYSQMSMRYGNFYFEVMSNNTLRVYSSSYSSSDQCAFTMNTKSGGNSSSDSGTGLPQILQFVLIVFVVMICCCLSCVKHQYNQAARQNIIQSQPQENYIFKSAPSNVYVVPNQTYVASNGAHQFSQNAYVAPNNDYLFQNNAYAPSNNNYAPPSNVYAPANNGYGVSNAHQQSIEINHLVPPEPEPYSNMNQKPFYTPY